ncbi:CHAT domain-containing protein [Chitinophaga sp. S165]|uniref:CHAT domain-containing protein n=1 Tax=Chitinophaga sp. S165 TaxID=2135462 RepID=UPI000D70F465|nr:CHAT domain-containing protein [Chitinophaga sp. S165]PWV51567.1 CHAT domain-containing protein [Chitinophaga sp. S165]
MKRSTNAYNSASIQVVALLQEYCNQQLLSPGVKSPVQPMWDFLASVFKSAQQQQLLKAFSKTPLGKPEEALLQMIDAKIAKSPDFQMRLRELFEQIPKKLSAAPPPQNAPYPPDRRESRGGYWPPFIEFEGKKSEDDIFKNTDYFGQGTPLILPDNTADSDEDPSPGIVDWGLPSTTPSPTPYGSPGPGSSISGNDPSNWSNPSGEQDSSSGMKVFRRSRSLKPAKPAKRGYGVGNGVFPDSIPSGKTTKEISPSPAKAVTKKVTCHFQASTKEQVVKEKPVAVEVTISRNEIEAIPGRVTATAKSKVKADKMLTISIHPEINCIIKGDFRKKIEVPAAGESAVVSFSAMFTHIGPCKLHIEISQEQVPMASLTLEPVCVEKEAPAGVTNATAIADAPAPFPKAVNQLRIREHQVGTNSYYTYELDVPGLEILDLFESPTITVDRQKYIAQLYTEIEELWDNTNGNMKVFNMQLRDYGATLFMQLFPEKLRNILYKNTLNITSIQVISTEPFIPWELLLVKHPDQQVAWQSADKFLGEMGLTRWLHGWTPAKELVIRKDQAKYVIPQYQDPQHELPAGQLEAKYLKKAFGAVEVEPSTLTVTELLREGKFDLLHFCCHGGADMDNITHAKLLLKEEYKNGELKPTYLTQTTVQGCGSISRDGSRPLVVVNACETGRLGNGLTGYGGFAKAFLNAGAGAFIGSLWAVEDNAAVSFITSFYDELKAGKTLSEATVNARAKASAEPDSAWISYVVYGHPFAVLKR